VMQIVLLVLFTWNWDRAYGSVTPHHHQTNKHHNHSRPRDSGGESKGPAKVTSQYSTTEAVSSNVTKTLNISDNDTAGLPSKKGKFEGAMRHLNSGISKGMRASQQYLKGKGFRTLQNEPPPSPHQDQQAQPNPPPQPQTIKSEANGASKQDIQTREMGFRTLQNEPPPSPHQDQQAQPNPPPQPIISEKQKQTNKSEANRASKQDTLLQNEPPPSPHQDQQALPNPPPQPSQPSHVNHEQSKATGAPHPTTALPNEQTSTAPPVTTAQPNEPTSFAPPVTAALPNEPTSTAPPVTTALPNELKSAPLPDEGQVQCRCDRACMNKCKMSWSITFGVGPF